MRDTADHLVAWLMDRVGVSVQPPIDVNELAFRMEIDSIEESEMVEDGRLEQRHGNATIYIRNDLTGGLTRF